MGNIPDTNTLQTTKARSAAPLPFSSKKVKKRKKILKFYISILNISNILAF